MQLAMKETLKVTIRLLLILLLAVFIISLNNHTIYVHCKLFVTRTLITQCNLHNFLTVIADLNECNAPDPVCIIGTACFNVIRSYLCISAPTYQLINDNGFNNVTIYVSWEVLT